MNDEIISVLKEKGADIVAFADISKLGFNQNLGFPSAIVICSSLSREFILATKENGKPVEPDEFVLKEKETDALADWLAEYLKQKKYNAYSQSEENNFQSGNFNVETKSSRLPHKTVALLAGTGYIGKNNLLINKDYGCAFSMCTVLTDAPLETECPPPISSQCGNCSICKEVCANNAILGNEWVIENERESIIDVFKCSCPLKCMVHCPKTLRYAMS